MHVEIKYILFIPTYSAFVRYLKSFYTYKKINNIFLKFHQCLLRMQKIAEIGWIFHSEKLASKT